MKKFVSKLLVLLMTISIVVPQFMTAKASAATYMNDCQIGSGSIDLYDDKGNESTFTSSKVLTKYVGRGGDVVVPDGIQIIGYGAFKNCTNVTSITLPDSLLYIDGEAFENTGISNIVIPKNVKVVYGYSSAPAHGSLILDTSSYSMSSGKTYQIGAKVTSSSTYLKVYSTNSGIASVNSSNYKVTGRGYGTAWIMFDVYDSSTNKKIGHASTKIDIKNGTKPHGNSARQIARF